MQIIAMYHLCRSESTVDVSLNNFSDIQNFTKNIQKFAKIFRCIRKEFVEFIGATYAAHDSDIQKNFAKKIQMQEIRENIYHLY